ncbi:MAG: MmgE/PrpD family protein [bacterium]|nr:MmgE/PrpD family protein [bacterium]
MAAFAAGARYEDLPAEVSTSIRQRILDIAGLNLAARPLSTSDMAIAVARQWGSPGPPGGGQTQQGPEGGQTQQGAQLIAYEGRLPAAAAGFVNGTLAHSLDFDDTHLPSVLHPSASVVPAALAAGEAVGASRHEVLVAAATGYEICIRTGMAAYDRELGNSVFFERGWHATSICGTLAAAAVGARLYGLGADGIGHAMGIAASMGSGIIGGTRAGASVKRLHCGWAVHAGLVAAQCAREGITGPPTAFEGRFGFYQAYCGGTLFEDEITRGLGTEWCIPGVFYKPYPANHFTHAGIDAAMKIRRCVAVEDIEAIELRVSSPTLRTIAQPREQKIRPQSGYHGQFSGPFTIAVALLGGGGGLGVWLDDFNDANARDPRYLDLAAKVEVTSDPECDAIFPHQFPAILRVRTRGGEEHEERVMANRGGPQNPLSEEEIKIKFRANASRTLGSADAERLANAILDADDKPVAELLRPAQEALAADRKVEV